MSKNKNVFDNVLQLIGSTPLIKLNKMTADFDGDFYAKVEAFNPGHSSKDRIALHIIEEAERQGILTPGGIMSFMTVRLSPVNLTIVKYRE